MIWVDLGSKYDSSDILVVYMDKKQHTAVLIK